MLSERRILAVGIVSGTLLRLAHTFTSIGSLDAFLWYRWVELIQRVGILSSYRYSEMMNHPPLALLIATATAQLGGLAGLEFQDSFRILQTLADIVSACALVRIARACGVSPVAAALLFFLSPAAIFVSGFHCNSDPLMMMLVLLAIVAMLAGRAGVAGALVAAGVGIKIVALFALPFLFLAFRGRARALFLGAATAVGAAIFIPGVIVSGPLFVKHVVGYSGMVTGWGIRLLAGWSEPWIGARGFAASGRIALVALLVALAALWIREWRRGVQPARAPLAIGLAYLVVLVLAPGFGVQYLYWILPFLGLLFDRRAAIALHGLISVFMFALYTAWAEGWPWWYAQGKSPSPGIGFAIVCIGLVVWLALAVATVRAARAR